jgi:hypothetical protein
MKSSLNLFRNIACLLFLFSGMAVQAQTTAGATATVYNEFVVGITVTNGGTGYTFAPAVTITGGGGAGAASYATISNGVVTAITVTNAGSGYTSTPQVIITAPSTTPFAASLVLDLPLDGSVVDMGPNKFSVITNGGGTFVPDRFQQTNSALALDGASQNISIPYDARLYPTEFTFSAWVNLQQLTTSGTFWRAGNGSSDGWQGFSLYFNGPNSFIYNDFTGSGYNAVLTISPTNFVVETWYQIVITRKTNSCAMFINGSNVASQTGVTPYTKPQTTPMSLGANDADPTGFNYFCPVTFDTVHIYNRALSSNEVFQLYAAEAKISLAPTITNQPQSQLVNALAPASFSVAATAVAPLSYQWTLDNTILSGATTTTLTITNVQPSDLGGYRVVITNAYGAVTSSVANLYMYPYLATPFDGAVTYWGQTNVLSIQAWGSGPLTYQWYQDGAAVPGGTNQTLNLGSVQFTNAGLYSVVVSSGYGSVTNSPYEVVVNPANVSIKICPDVVIQGTVGYSYVIQSTTNLGDPNAWQVETNLTLTAPVQNWNDNNTDTTQPNNPHKFYRVIPGQ